MKRICLQFCPSCGDYWVPRNREEASRKIDQLCMKCHVKVELSWLGFILLAVLLFLLFATSLFPGANKLALGILFFLLSIAALKAFKQHQALKRTSKSGKNY